MPPRVRRIAFTAAVLSLALLIGLRSAWAAYACRVDGEVRDACCCPKKPKHSERTPADGAAHMQASSCCDVTIGESADPPQARETDRAHAGDVPLAVVATGTDASIKTPVGVRTLPHAFARPPPRSVPTYLANRTILR